MEKAEKVEIKIMKKKINEITVGRLLVTMAVVLQFLSICYFNFTKTEVFLDYDSALAIRHAVDMWRSHTIFLKDFVYVSSMELDCASFFAAPIYILTNNLSLSIGLVHILLDGILIGCIYALMKNLKLSYCYRLLAILLIFTPYSYGQLQYNNMLFLSVGQYEFRVISAISILMMLTYREEKKKTLYYIAGLIISVGVVFWTVLSTGLYICLTLIIPIIVFEVIKSIKEQKIEKTKIRIIFLYVLAAMFGFALQKGMHIELLRTNLNLTKSKEFVDNFFSMIFGIVNLFGGATRKEITVFSLDGILIMIRFIFSIIVIIMPFVAWKMKILKEKNFVGYVSSIALVNIFVLSFAYVNYSKMEFAYRYHLVWILPWLILDVVCMAEFMEVNKNNRYLRNSIAVIVAMGILIMNIGGFRYLSEIPEETYQQELAVLEEADKLGFDNIAVYNKDWTMSHVLNALDIDKNVKGVDIMEDGVRIVDTYDQFMNPNLSERHILLIKQKHVKKLPEDIISNYKYIKDIDKYSIYQTENFKW